MLKFLVFYGLVLEKSRTYDNFVESIYKEGKIEGIKQNKIETAKKMKEEKIVIEVIKRITGLTEEKIN